MERRELTPCLLVAPQMEILSFVIRFDTRVRPRGCTRLFFAIRCTPSHHRLFQQSILCHVEETLVCGESCKRRERSPIDTSQFESLHHCGFRMPCKALEKFVTVWLKRKSTSRRAASASRYAWMNCIDTNGTLVPAIVVHCASVGWCRCPSRRRPMPSYINWGKAGQTFDLR